MLLCRVTNNMAENRTINVADQQFWVKKQNHPELLFEWTNGRSCHWLTGRDRLCYRMFMKMTSLNVSLPIEMKQFIEAKLSSGYGTVSEYIRELVRADQKREAQVKAAEEKVVAMLLEGVRQLERGEGIEVTPEYWEKLRREVIERHAKKQQR